MGKYDDKVKGLENERPLAEVPMWPKVCSVAGCNAETQVAWVIAYSPSTNSNISRMFADVGHVQDGPKGRRYTMRGDYQFRRWVTRCATCYMAEAISTGKNQLTVESDKTFINDHREKLRRMVEQ